MKTIISLQVRNLVSLLTFAILSAITSESRAQWELSTSSFTTNAIGIVSYNVFPWYESGSGEGSISTSTADGSHLNISGSCYAISDIELSEDPVTNNEYVGVTSLFRASGTWVPTGGGGGPSVTLIGSGSASGSVYITNYVHYSIDNIYAQEAESAYGFIRETSLVDGDASAGVGYNYGASTNGFFGSEESFTDETIGGGTNVDFPPGYWEGASANFTISWGFDYVSASGLTEIDASEAARGASFAEMEIMEPIRAWGVSYASCSMSGEMNLKLDY